MLQGRKQETQVDKTRWNIGWYILSKWNILRIKILEPNSDKWKSIYYFKNIWVMLVREVKEWVYKCSEWEARASFLHGGGVHAIWGDIIMKWFFMSRKVRRGSWYRIWKGGVSAMEEVVRTLGRSAVDYILWSVRRSDFHSARYGVYSHLQA